MDPCASVLLAFPPQGGLAHADNETYHKAASAHKQRLSKLVKERPGDLVDHGPALFELLDPAVHSLSYLTVIHALTTLGLPITMPLDRLLEKIVVFMMTFDGRQCRYAGLHLLVLMETVGRGLLLPAPVAVEALAAAILNLDPSGTMLTSSHLFLVHLAYGSGHVEAALPVIEKAVIFYPATASHEVAQYPCELGIPPPSYISRTTGLTSVFTTSMVLEYTIFSGIIWANRREWARAKAAFERAVAFPTSNNGCSKIMAEAFKKWILVGLLLEGKHPAPPPHASSLTVKTLKVLGNPYVSLAAAFEADDVGQLKLEVDRNAQLWQEDQNVGLVYEIVAAYQKWRVLSLQTIYTKISIAEIRQQTRSAETGEALATDQDVEALIQNMIIGGMLKGVIEKNDNGTTYLNFLPPATHLSDKEYKQHATARLKRLAELDAIIQATNQRLATCQEHIRWLAKERNRDKSMEPQDPTLAFEAQIDDEDLMGGVPAF